MVTPVSDHDSVLELVGAIKDNLPMLLREAAKRTGKGAMAKACLLPYELASWRDLVVSVHALGEEWSQGDLWAPRVRYALVKCNRLFTPSDLGLL
ncbi:UNVERIFIED_CONTAM: hypothetical protein Slati_4564700 [Sesamum latifolium]|uniref:Uncharacterized protein n=2 Tax=Sesamum latifolium TaxID=2727402 RepID=A0AAW2SFT9_9LAMI